MVIQKRIIISFAFFVAFVFHNAHAQNMKLMYKAKVKAERLITDRLGNFYLIDGSKLTKYNPDGMLLFIYDENSYGNIAQIDAFDPFKIMLYYPAFMHTVFLNEQLTIINQFDLATNNGLGVVSVMCATNENNYWLFDTNIKRLRRLERTGKIIAEGTFMQSDSMFQLNNLQKIEDTEMYLFMSDQNGNLSRFDKFGNFISTYAMGADILDYQGSGSHVYFLQKDNIIHSYDFNDFTETVMQVPDDIVALHFRIEKNKLFILTDTEVRIYLLTE